MLTQTQKKIVDPELLVHRIMDGDASAESDFVDAYGRGITFVLRKETRDEETLEDLFQETFRIGLEKIRKGDLREPKKLGGFMCSIARFAVIDHYRHEARHENRVEKSEDGSWSQKGEDQLQEILRREHSEMIRRVIGDLKSERDRQILFRFFIAEDDKANICRDLDLTTLHFNRVLHRAKQRYKSLYLRMLENDGRENQAEVR